MEINIKPEEIDKYVKNAIIESSVGKIINDAGKKFMDEIISNRYDSPIKSILHNVVKQLFEDEIKKPENIDLIKKKISEVVTESAVTQVVSKMLDKIGYCSIDFR